jgi:carboxyl-terminal processing protease
MSESIEGNFGGIGVRFFKLRDTICISSVIPNSPSARVGLKQGDQIVEIKGVNAAGVGISNEEIMAKLKGEKGTSVGITVNRYGQLIPFTIKRGTIPIQTVSCAYMVNKDIGYLKLNQFSVRSAQEFRVASKQLLSSGMKGMILDLRDNGGGVLQSATSIADEFLKSGLSIVRTAGRKIGSQVYKAKSGGILENINVTVLINSRSASASEIVAGAIQDNDRGTIVGRRSFGKGLVQEDQKLRDGSIVRITIARYYTPSGRCIQRPYSGEYEEYYEDITRTEESLFRIDSSIYVDSLKYTTVGGRTVYGGGGISPDVFVPLDTTGTSTYYTSLLWSGAINQFAFDYVKRNKYFDNNSWSSAKVFDSKFIVNDRVILEFQKYAKEELNIQVSGSNDLSHCKKKLKTRIKAEIARQIWLENGFFKVFNPTDQEFLKAMGALAN